MNAVIFDMDGVLVNSEPHHFKVEAKIFSSLGFQVSKEEMMSFVGMSLQKFWTNLKHRFSLEQSIEELVENDNKVRIDYFAALDCLHPVEGISELLADLKDRNIKLALASSSHRKMIDIVIDKLGIHSFFDYIISGHDIKHGKPAPDIFLKAAAELHEKPEDCLVIEDSANGIKAANAAGIPCIGFKNPDSGNQDLSGATLVIDCFNGISSAFLEKVKCIA